MQVRTVATTRRAHSVREHFEDRIEIGSHKFAVWESAADEREEFVVRHPIPFSSLDLPPVGA